MKSNSLSHLYSPVSISRLKSYVCFQKTFIHADKKIYLFFYIFYLGDIFVVSSIISLAFHSCRVFHLWVA